MWETITTPITWFVKGIGKIVDFIWSRADLWSNKGTKEADAGKVRQFIMYITVGYVMVYLAHNSENITTSYLFILLLMLCAAVSDRAFIMVLKMWNARPLSADSPTDLIKKALTSKITKKENDDVQEV